MPLVLIPEDGSGVTGANSYVTLDEANAYLAYNANRVLWAALSDDDKIAAIVQGTLALDSGCAWKGDKVDINQPLAWPRYGVQVGLLNESPEWSPRQSGYSPIVSERTIPEAVKKASMEMAALMMKGDRTADADGSGVKKLNLGDSALEIEFNHDTAPTLLGPFVPKMVSDYCRSSNGRGRINSFRV